MNETPNAPKHAYISETEIRELEQRLEDVLRTQRADPKLFDRIKNLRDPVAIKRIDAISKKWGINQVSPTLNIADYYRPGTVKYQLRWPLSSGLLLPVPFDKLDREPQFYVLFAEWSRRELEGNMARDAGDLAGAQEIFEECLSRSEHLEIAELRARSFEGLVRIAQKRGDRHAEGKWVDAAQAARAKG